MLTSKLDKEMKKYILTLAVLVLGFTQVAAQKLFVDPVVEVPQGGQAKVAIKYETEGKVIKGFGIAFILPEGITTVKKSNGRPDYQIHSDYATGDNAFGMVSANDGWTGTSTDGQLQGESGTIFYAILAADESLELNSEHEVRVTKLMVTVAEDGKNKSVYFDDFYFTVKIVENVVTLDENSTTAPEAATGVNVKVLRTIKAKNWSTICLPFAMTEPQVKETFGEDVELADFTGYDFDEDAQNITVNFSTINSIEANHPCIIKVASDISEFSVNGVDIDPEDEPGVILGTGGKGRGTKNYKAKDFIGTYVAEFDFYTDACSYPLFLSGNKFWYASESSKFMKAFRGYFDFYDTLDEAGEVKMQIDGIFDGINNIDFTNTNGAVFTIDGKKLNSDVTKLPKGVYIIDGKKVAIK